MPVLEGKELRIVAFLCNWCSYGGADTAGVARATQPTDLRIIRVPCSGRIDPLFILRALLNGADGVLVSGCHPNDCHYSAGNFYARRRLEVLKQFLPILGIDDRRFEYTWVSASEGARWQQVVTNFTARIHELGPAPRLEDAEPLVEMAEMALKPLRPLGTGQKAPLDDLKNAIKARLKDLDVVIGWQKGYDDAHTVPLFMRTEEDVDRLHSSAFDPLGLETDLELESIGRHNFRSQGEHHRYNPRTIHLLQQAVWNNDYDLFRQYTALVDEEQTGYLRSLMEFVYPEEPVPLEEVESVESIVRRFKTGAMSYGSISQEAHETLAIAMNRIHGKSNSGEGGESPERLESKGTREDRCSAIKQVASGRFGVTSRYLVSADEIQIKMAQGAKPGEGGHLPGKKVYPWIAKTRYSTPGVSLISPPPHHDIYSIEDLAQLIYDLKNANKKARISVKLVSEAGVGTIASGVAKAGAQVVLISGYDGGTGAAPGSSIHNAGLPWELGLAETHQTLLKNGLRRQVKIETDGKLMSGRDVAIAAILGAEEFGFATAPLVTLGCVMMRVCNQDTCPMGVATQNPRLRKCFKGKPEYVIHFMEMIARELREYMAVLGVRTVDELVGRTDLLRAKEMQEGSRGARIDLRAILEHPYSEVPNQAGLYDFGLEKTLDETVLMKTLGRKLESGEQGEVLLQVGNTDRTFGTMFGSEITRRYPDGLPEDTYRVICRGTGGQSFGAFIPRGLTIELHGDSNDYFGKGLSGGKLVIRPPKGAGYRAEENMIIGNVAFYGATSGKAFICGMAGERFCVRNSGATVVVEGTGDHGCEYMTGGKAVILGPTGKNFAAGMSGGIAYVLDETNSLYRNINKAMISMEDVEAKGEKDELEALIREHVERTGSEKGAKILEHFQEYLPKFKKVIPNDYKKMLKLSRHFEELGMISEQAQVEAFYAATGQKPEGGEGTWENR